MRFSRNCNLFSPNRLGTDSCRILRFQFCSWFLFGQLMRRETTLAACDESSVSPSKHLMALKIIPREPKRIPSATRKSCEAIISFIKILEAEKLKKKSLTKPERESSFDGGFCGLQIRCPIIHGNELISINNKKTRSRSIHLLGSFSRYVKATNL